MMNELSLFSGAGGGLLGTKLLDWNHIGYVEFNEYCQKVIAQRIKDGILDEAPIFGDIRTFISEGYAESYQGMVDVITAGFPCQPFSVAGKRKGQDDERNMWPATIDVIRTVRPRFALLENVPGLFAHEYARTIFRDLAESGYECRWRILSAAEVGAPHKRDRIFIVAHANSQSESGESTRIKKGVRVVPYTISGDGRPNARARSRTENESEKFLKENGKALSGNAAEICGDVADTKFIGRDEMEQPIKGRKRGERSASEAQYSSSARRGEWWRFEPDVGRMANGVASRVDRLKAIGNGQVPAVVRAAWEILSKPVTG